MLSFQDVSKNLNYLPGTYAIRNPHMLKTTTQRISEPLSCFGEILSRLFRSVGGSSIPLPGALFLSSRMGLPEQGKLEIYILRLFFCTLWNGKCTLRWSKRTTSCWKDESGFVVGYFSSFSHFRTSPVPCPLGGLLQTSMKM